MTTSILWGKAHGVAVMPYNKNGVKNGLSVATTDMYNELLFEKIRVENRKRVIPHQSTPIQIRQLLQSQAHLSPESIFTNMPKQGEQTSSWESEPIINLVEALFETALNKNATDIHLEPTSNQFRIRLRIDGELCDYQTLPLWLAEPVLIRLKILANVDITDRRVPHDGRLSYQGLCHQANVRLSTLPVRGGEKCVLRLLPILPEEQTLDDLHFTPMLLQQLRKIFSSPQGLLLITGPTGSGKTTTLYAGLREILRHKINVTTIEDPVEYELFGANQVQVNEKCGITFAEALRSILRQDPDVILIGEIRDSETANIALRAAQTGHLVLATLHTNSAQATFSRLEDLGLNKKWIQESLLGIMAQRLLRKQNGGRTAVSELLLPNGNYTDGSLRQNALTLVKQGIVTEDEVNRVLGQPL